MIHDKLRIVVREHILSQVGDRERVQALISDANEDLYCGPVDTDASRTGLGFVALCRELRAALGGLLGDLWVDEACDCVDGVEPDWDAIDEDGCRLYCPEDWYHFDGRGVARAVLGIELAGYV